MADIAIFDPLGSFVLAPKAKKLLESGKLAGIRVNFTPSGAVVEAAVPLATGETTLNFRGINEVMASLPEKGARPFADEKAHLVSKYEIRLDEEAPAGLRNATTQVALDAAVAALAFAKRRALQMSNKEFEMAFLRWEAGTAVPRPAEQADALRQERAAARGGGGRGRGRGGRGRGSFRGAPVAPVTGPQAGQNAQ